MSMDPHDQPPAAEPQPSRPIVPKSAKGALRPERGVAPPRRSRRSRSQFVVFLNFIVACLVLVAVGGLVVAWLGKSMFEGPGPAQHTELVMIRPNSSSATIADTLERAGVINDARVFRIGLRVNGADNRLKAGEYEIKAGASMRDIMELLESGKSVLASLTIPEGLTVQQAFQRIAENDALSGDMPSEMPPEGGLLAETERFTRGMQRQALIDKLVARQKELVDTIWERRQPDLPINTKEEFVTLASIVEKETAVADERPRIAGVFMNRLRKSMRLQSDPTIVYGLFGGAGKPADRAIYRSDIEKTTPYNTYRIDGLPPTPIAIPGQAALEAVANPSQTNELYFVADGTGGHVFSKTLAEHNDNVARWRKFRREQAQNAGQSATEAEETLPVE
ncbi:endolytic transglycosylase MltG [Tianweitania sp. BSSL-BM11]|uniref:Endolytic murein transglycosylase n=1 Tax=Tianweitania aestuarii TaxID=2814886 RepID=A0ABS5RSF7_9HYPH|nr:endolytic transglycosylase MltG [Tianweitania aestuarii]MBS9719993.1 endolytic transglycosylase MltG [Tianweitania aestuarii]